MSEMQVIKAQEIPMDIMEDFFGQTSIQNLQNQSIHKVKKKKVIRPLNKEELNNQIYTSTLFLRDSTINPNAHRTRTFEFKQIDRANLFEGLPYVQFDAFVRRDRNMQQIIIRDLLKILADKCNSFKNLIMDRAKMKKIFCLMVPVQRSKMNSKLEESIGLLNSISLIILLDFKDSPESIGLKPSPIKSNPPAEIRILDEERIFEQNLEIYNDMVQFFRDCIDAFMIMSRQLEHKSLEELVCFNLMQQVTKIRFNLSEMGEEIRVYDKNSDEKVKRINFLLPPVASEKVLKNIFKGADPQFLRDSNVRGSQPQKIVVDRSESPQQRHLETQNRIEKQMQKKFNFGRNRYQTRESKIVLNQDKIESEKALILESNSKTSKIKNFSADNRKLLAMERLRDPTKDPEIRSALFIAARVLNINIEDQL